MNELRNITDDVRQKDPYVLCYLQTLRVVLDQYRRAVVLFALAHVPNDDNVYAVGVCQSTSFTGTHDRVLFLKQEKGRQDWRVWRVHEGTPEPHWVYKGLANHYLQHIALGRKLEHVPLPAMCPYERNHDSSIGPGKTFARVATYERSVPNKEGGGEVKIRCCSPPGRCQGDAWSDARIAAKNYQERVSSEREISLEEIFDGIP